MYNGRTVLTLIVAAGAGTRMGGKLPKQFLAIDGTPMLIKTAEVFERHGDTDGIYVVASPDYMALCRELLADMHKLRDVLPGGETRQDSVRLGLQAMAEAEGLAGEPIVLIHDAARPFVDAAIIDRVTETAAQRGAAIPCIPMTDTIYAVAQVDEAQADGAQAARILQTAPDRKSLFAVQTPQGFALSLILKAHEQAAEAGKIVTDDGIPVKLMGHPVSVVQGGVRNRKITTAADMAAVQQAERRVGIGFDVHAFAVGRKLILGGREIPYERGLEGHSDADVLTHALMDAMLGALDLGDIGRHFPDTDPQYAGISSLKLLRRVRALMESRAWTIENADMTIIAERPKMARYISDMKEELAAALGLESTCVSIKATTTEGLGFTGREEGIGAQAVVLLRRREDG
jgi:2-C-methyl-D-erythritol 4-phosphate cytidylyltransferase/2-C-methyl-D-erythritol 2,4-cyclodiphosphate synthase